MGGDCHHHEGPNKYVMLGMIIDQYHKFPLHNTTKDAVYAPIVNVVEVGMYWNFTTSREKGLTEKKITKNWDQQILLSTQVKGQSDVQDSTLLLAPWRSQIGLTGFYHLIIFLITIITMNTT